MARRPKFATGIVQTGSSHEGDAKDVVRDARVRTCQAIQFSVDSPRET